MNLMSKEVKSAWIMVTIGISSVLVVGWQMSWVALAIIHIRQITVCYMIRLISPWKIQDLSSPEFSCEIHDQLSIECISLSLFLFHELPVLWNTNMVGADVHSILFLFLCLVPGWVLSILVSNSPDFLCWWYRRIFCFNGFKIIIIKWCSWINIIIP